jgi:AAA ATPase domain/AAA domain, putative AbiEii toxin, Type IV TA system
MKLEKIQIENFRGIQHLEMDLQDELGRVLDQVPIVGPNTSGKTSILDAITLCLGPVTELRATRPDLALSPASIVRRGSVRARVVCEVRFSDEELAKTKETLERAGHPDAKKVPHANKVQVDWQYPDPSGQSRSGWNHFEPHAAYSLFKGRVVAGRNLHVPGVGARSFRELGGVFMFDQKRTGLAQRMTAEMRALAGRDGESLEEEEAPGRGGDYTSDPRLILLHLASRAQAPQGPETTEHEDYERLRELYARVCAPHTIKGLYNTESGLDMEFEGPQGTYLFDGLSSGQLMILLLLLRFARGRIHNSIVLIDELELHLHPLWQTRLYQGLRDLGVENQYFFTAHSTHLRDLIRGDFFHCTGELGDEAVKKEEA